MNEHDLAYDSFGEDQGKDRQNIPDIINLAPHFDELDNLNSCDDKLNNHEIIINHIDQLLGKGEKISHKKILDQLLSEIEPVDFETLAFPEKEILIKELDDLGTLPAIQDDSLIKDYGMEEKRDLSKSLKYKLSKLKLNMKHFLIISIQIVVNVAQKNRWGLCKNEAFIYMFNGAYWSELGKERFQKFLGEAAEKMGVDKFSAKFYQFREHLIKQFFATEYLPTPEENKDQVMINLMNGTYEISPNKQFLRAFDQADFIRYQLPFSYDPKAEAPLFQAFLDRVLPDIECQTILAEYLGFMFIKHGSSLKLEKALILYGTGANGKSVFFEVVTALFGKENVSNYSVQSLTEEKGYYRAKISNKLVNYASEINNKLESSKFKLMASGEPVEACLKYGQPFIMSQYAKFIFNCNELPKDIEYTNAFFRRWLIIPFEVTIPEHEQDKTLHAKIIEKELSGVFNWVLTGLNRLLAQKRFSNCEAALKAVEQYKIESDSVKMFLNEHQYMVSTTNDKPLKDLFGEYKIYCNDSGFRSVSVRTLADRLRKSILCLS